MTSDGGLVVSFSQTSDPRNNGTSSSRGVLPRLLFKHVDAVNALAARYKQGGKFGSLHLGGPVSLSPEPLPPVHMHVLVSGVTAAGVGHLIRIAEWAARASSAGGSDNDTVARSSGIASGSSVETSSSPDVSTMAARGVLATVLQLLQHNLAPSASSAAAGQQSLPSIEAELLPTKAQVSLEVAKRRAERDGIAAPSMTADRTGKGASPVSPLASLAPSDTAPLLWSMREVLLQSLSLGVVGHPSLLPIARSVFVSTFNVLYPTWRLKTMALGQAIAAVGRGREGSIGAAASAAAATLDCVMSALAAMRIPVDKRGLITAPALTANVAPGDVPGALQLACVSAPDNAAGPSAESKALTALEPLLLDLYSSSDGTQAADAVSTGAVISTPAPSIADLVGLAKARTLAGMQRRAPLSSTSSSDGDGSSGDSLSALLCAVNDTVCSRLQAAALGGPAASSSSQLNDGGGAKPSPAAPVAAAGATTSVAAAASSSSRPKLSPLYSATRFLSAQSVSWGYGGAADAVSFQCTCEGSAASSTVYIAGFGLYAGSAGTMTGDMRLCKGKQDVKDGDNLLGEAKVEWASENAEVQEVLFDEPIPIETDQWYTAVIAVTSKISSHSGSAAQTTVEGECGEVQFKFKQSSGSSNGTSETGGQIPAILYQRVVANPSPVAEPAPVASAGLGNLGTLLRSPTGRSTDAASATAAGGGSDAVLEALEARQQQLAPFTSLLASYFAYAEDIVQEAAASGMLAKQQAGMLKHPHPGVGGGAGQAPSSSSPSPSDSPLHQLPSHVLEAVAADPILAAVLPHLLSLAHPIVSKDNFLACDLMPRLTSALQRVDWLVDEARGRAIAAHVESTTAFPFPRLPPLHRDPSIPEPPPLGRTISDVSVSALPPRLGRSVSDISVSGGESSEAVAAAIAQATASTDPAARALAGLRLADDAEGVVERRVIESAHPYPPATRKQWDVAFDEADVHFLVVCFDKACATVQPEDRLTLYTDRTLTRSIGLPYHGQVAPSGVLLEAKKKLHSRWPAGTILVPGNTLTVVFESATDYVNNASLSRYGFGLVVTAHGRALGSTPSLRHLALLSALERELAHLTAITVAASTLAKPNLSDAAVIPQLMVTRGTSADVAPAAAAMAAAAPLFTLPTAAPPSIKSASTVQASSVPLVDTNDWSWEPIGATNPPVIAADQVTAGSTSSSGAMMSTGIASGVMEWVIEINEETSSQCTCIGVCTADIDTPQYSGNKNAWTYRCYNGFRYARGKEERSGSRSDEKVNKGDRAHCSLDMDAGTLTLTIRDQDPVVIFKDLLEEAGGRELYPCVLFYSNGPERRVTGCDVKVAKAATKSAAAGAGKAATAPGAGALVHQAAPAHTTADAAPPSSVSVAFTVADALSLFTTNKLLSGGLLDKATLPEWVGADAVSLLRSFADFEDQNPGDSLDPAIAKAANRVWDFFGRETQGSAGADYTSAAAGQASGLRKLAPRTVFGSLVDYLVYERQRAASQLIERAVRSLFASLVWHSGLNGAFHSVCMEISGDEGAVADLIETVEFAHLGDSGSVMELLKHLHGCAEAAIARHLVLEGDPSTAAAAAPPGDPAAAPAEPEGVDGGAGAGAAPATASSAGASTPERDAALVATYKCEGGSEGEKKPSKGCTASPNVKAKLRALHELWSPLPLRITSTDGWVTDKARHFTIPDEGKEKYLVGPSTEGRRGGAGGGLAGAGFGGGGDAQKEPSLIYAAPFDRGVTSPSDPCIFYFEVEVIDMPKGKDVAIGLLAGGDNTCSSHLGKRQASFGWHAGGGGVMFGSGMPEVGSYNEGDTIGCGYVPSLKTVFFTLNGEVNEYCYAPHCFAKAHRTAQPDEATGYWSLRPAITCGEGARFMLNQGQAPFMFNAADAAREAAMTDHIMRVSKAESTAAAAGASPAASAAAPADVAAVVAPAAGDGSAEKSGVSVAAGASSAPSLTASSSSGVVDALGAAKVTPSVVLARSAFLLELNPAVAAAVALNPHEAEQAPAAVQSLLHFVFAGPQAVAPAPATAASLPTVTQELEAIRGALQLSERLAWRRVEGVTAAATLLSSLRSAPACQEILFPLTALLVNEADGSTNADSIVASKLTPVCDLIAPAAAAGGSALLHDLVGSGVAVRSQLDAAIKSLLVALVGVAKSPAIGGPAQALAHTSGRRDGDGDAASVVQVTPPLASRAHRILQHARRASDGRANGTIMPASHLTSSRVWARVLALRCLRMPVHMADLHVLSDDKQDEDADVFAMLLALMSGGGVDGNAVDSTTSLSPSPPPATLLLDITSPHCTIEPASGKDRKAQLTDASTETYWESDGGAGEKTIDVVVKQGAPWPVCVAVHVDNTRDKEKQCKSLVLRINGEDADTVALPSSYVGWATLRLSGDGASSASVSAAPAVPSLTLVAKGSGYVRLRGVRVFAADGGDGDGSVAPQPCRVSPCSVAARHTFHVLSAFIASSEGAPYMRGRLMRSTAAFMRSVVQDSRQRGSIDDKAAPALFELVDGLDALVKTTTLKDYPEHLALCLQLLPIAPPALQTALLALLTPVLPHQPVSTFESSESGVTEASLLAPKSLHTAALSAAEAAAAASPDSVLPGQASDDDDTLAAGPGSAAAHVLLLLGKAMTSQTRGRVNGKATTIEASMDKALVPGVVPPEAATALLALVKALWSSPAWGPAFQSTLKSAIACLGSAFTSHLEAPGKASRLPLTWLVAAGMMTVPEGILQDLLPAKPAPSSDAPVVADEPVKFCNHHDDGRTLADVTCAACAGVADDHKQKPLALCSSCDAFMHLPKAARGHTRHLLASSKAKAAAAAAAATVLESSAGCIRFKNGWLQVAVYPDRLRAMIEVKSEAHPRAAGRAAAAGSSAAAGSGAGPSQRDRCRFCDSDLTADNRLAKVVGSNAAGSAALENVCNGDECAEKAALCCTKIKACGHACGGVAGEEACFPCYLGCDGGSGACKVDNDTACPVCMEPLRTGPSIVLESCGHPFHAACIKPMIEQRWTGPRITFGFLGCPLCKAGMKHPSLSPLLEPILALQEVVRRKGLMRLRYENAEKVPELTDPASRYYKDPAAYATDKYAYYQCSKCSQPYYGGLAVCGEAQGGDVKFKREELVCGACLPHSADTSCPKHGADYIQWKCRFCCSPSLYFCFGTTHFCTTCHDRPGDMQTMQTEGKLPACPAGPLGKHLPGEPVTDCPLHMSHPPTGEEYCLGCSICREAQTF